MAGKEKVLVDTTATTPVNQDVKAATAAEGGSNMEHTIESAKARLQEIRDGFFAKIKEYSAVLATSTTIGEDGPGKGVGMKALIRMYHGAIMTRILDSGAKTSASTGQVIDFVVSNNLLPDNIVAEIVQWPGDGNPSEKIMRSFERTFNDRQGVWSSPWVKSKTYDLFIYWRFDKQDKNISKPIFKEIKALMAVAYPVKAKKKVEGGKAKGKKKAPAGKKVTANVNVEKTDSGVS